MGVGVLMTVPTRSGLLRHAQDGDKRCGTGPLRLSFSWVANRLDASRVSSVDWTGKLHHLDITLRTQDESVMMRYQHDTHQER